MLDTAIISIASLIPLLLAHLLARATLAALFCPRNRKPEIEFRALVDPQLTQFIARWEPLTDGPDATVEPQRKPVSYAPQTMNRPKPLTLAQRRKAAIGAGVKGAGRFNSAQLETLGY